MFVPVKLGNIVSFIVTVCEQKFRAYFIQKVLNRIWIPIASSREENIFGNILDICPYFGIIRWIMLDFRFFRVTKYKKPLSSSGISAKFRNGSGYSITQFLWRAKFQYFHQISFKVGSHMEKNVVYFAEFLVKYEVVL